MHIDTASLHCFINIGCKPKKLLKSHFFIILRKRKKKPEGPIPTLDNDMIPSCLKDVISGSASIKNPMWKMILDIKLTELSKYQYEWSNDEKMIFATLYQEAEKFWICGHCKSKTGSANDLLLCNGMLFYEGHNLSNNINIGADWGFTPVVYVLKRFEVGHKSGLCLYI